MVRAWKTMAALGTYYRLRVSLSNNDKQESFIRQVGLGEVSTSPKLFLVLISISTRLLEGSRMGFDPLPVLPPFGMHEWGKVKIISE
jgi:hypothetical protein